MDSNEEVEALVRLIGQLDGMYAEVSQLAKKSPNDAVNAFKIKLVNKLLAAANGVLGDTYRPFAEFNQFDADDVPSNSDVTVILKQYVVQVEAYRSDNVTIHDYKWVYRVGGEPSAIKTQKPTLVGGDVD